MTAEAKLGAEVLGYPPPRVFCRKSAEVVENKGREPQKERKEGKRVRNPKEAKEIKEVEKFEEQRSARFIRDNTRNGTIVSVCLSIVNLNAIG
jgi:hypothetical protein